MHILIDKKAVVGICLILPKQEPHRKYVQVLDSWHVCLWKKYVSNQPIRWRVSSRRWFNDSKKTLWCTPKTKIIFASDRVHVVEHATYNQARTAFEQLQKDFPNCNYIIKE